MAETETDDAGGPVRLTLRSYYADEYPEEVAILAGYLRARGYVADPEVIAEAWSAHCEDILCASWLDVAAQTGTAEGLAHAMDRLLNYHLVPARPISLRPDAAAGPDAAPGDAGLPGSHDAN